MSSPFWTLSQSRKISSPPSTEPHVLSSREIFRLEALGDSGGETQTGSRRAEEQLQLGSVLSAGGRLTAVVDGVGHDGFQRSGEAPVAVLQVGGEL